MHQPIRVCDCLLIDCLFVCLFDGLGPSVVADKIHAPVRFGASRSDPATKHQAKLRSSAATSTSKQANGLPLSLDAVVVVETVEQRLAFVVADGEEAAVRAKVEGRDIAKRRRARRPVGEHCQRWHMELRYRRAMGTLVRWLSVPRGRRLRTSLNTSFLSIEAMPKICESWLNLRLVTGVTIFMMALRGQTGEAEQRRLVPARSPRAPVRRRCAYFLGDGVRLERMDSVSYTFTTPE